MKLKDYYKLSYRDYLIHLKGFLALKMKLVSPLMHRNIWVL